MHQSENIKIKLITLINKDEYSWLILLYARVTLVGHFVSSLKEKEERDRRHSRGDEREGQGRKRKRNEREETEDKKKHSLSTLTLLQG